MRALAALSLLVGLLFADVGVQTSQPVSAQSAGVVYLTFDDGPSPYTSSVLDVLNRYGAKATFFVVGSSVSGRTSTMQAIANGGHAIANHTWSHPDLTGLSDTAIRSQLISTNNAIAAAVGTAGPCMRPPYGAINDRVSNIIAGLGMRPILWSIDTLDWQDSATVGSVVSRLNNARDGSIILMHDGGGNQSHTVAAVDQWLAANAGRFEFRVLPGCGGGGGGGGVPSVTGIGVSAVAGPSGELDLVTRDGAGTVWLRRWAGGGDTGWASLGGISTADPDATSWGGDRLDIVVRGADGAVWHRAREFGGWSEWTSLGGQAVGSPTIVASEPGRVDVFIRGTDDALYTKWWSGGEWHGWVSLGGGLTFSPDAVSYGPGEFDVYARGQDGALWQTWQSGGAWRGWAPIGGILTSSPGAATLGQGRVDVFVRGADGALWHTAWDSGAGWYGWDIGAGLLNSAPDAVWRGPNWLDVFMRGVDGQIWQMTWDGVSWIGPYVLA